jgi:glutathione S-transferase
MKLYLTPASGNSYKVRILLSLLGAPYEKVLVDTKSRQHKQAAFLNLNPRGEVPVLEDDGVVLWDSAAILVYLARRYGGDQWLPAAPAAMAQVMQWVALAGNEIQFGLQYARRGLSQNRWTAGTLEQG